jgi:hypothetical protein
MVSGQSHAEGADQPALSGRTIFVRYVLFAVMAGFANLATQEAVVQFLPARAPIMLSVLAGTAVGFVVKYILDKYYIFIDGYDGHIAEIYKVALYAGFSVATTMVFWGIELSFWYVWNTAEAKYAGAVLGLSIGNWLKYLLDRAWVFRKD